MGNGEFIMGFSLNINYKNGAKTFNMEQSELLLQTLIKHDVIIDAPCGGNHTCGKCKVIGHGGLSLLSKEEEELLSEEEISRGVRLACCVTIEGDCSVEIFRNDDIIVNKNEIGSDFNINPCVSLYHLILTKPSLQNQLSDEENLTLATEHFFTEKVAPSTLKKAPTFIRENDFLVNAVCCDNEIIDLLRPSDNLVVGMAVDIGTTTVAAYFYNLVTGERLETISSMNEQRAYGADVITRIQMCMDDPDGLKKLKNVIVSQINGFIEEFYKRTGIMSTSIYRVTIAGNTIMLHLFSGLDPKNIANAPFIPVSRFGNTIKANLIGLNIAEEGSIYIAPSIASYVGGDITAGIIAANIDYLDKKSLFIDIGTNGEMVVSNQSEIISCSTAAGPAFEGAQIKHGTGGIVGAISKVWVEDRKIKFETIGNVTPIGICGSGLLDAIACMLELSIIDETGYMEEDEFILDEKTGISITGQDVREVQLAKAAIAAGINTLLHETGLKFDDLDEVIIAGGFGSHINPKSACEIGLLPMAILDKIRFIGNAAGQGAVMALLDIKSYDRLKNISKNAKYLELSGNQFFQHDYIEQMCFE